VKAVSKTEGRRFEPCRPCPLHQANSLHLTASSRFPAPRNGDQQGARQTENVAAQVAAQAVAHVRARSNVGATPLGRVAEPGDMVGTPLYLLGPGAAFVSGQVVLVNGGRVAG
jgi:hypothetical protein